MRRQFIIGLRVRENTLLAWIVCCVSPQDYLDAGRRMKQRRLGKMAQLFQIPDDASRVTRSVSVRNRLIYAQKIRNEAHQPLYRKHWQLQYVVNICTLCQTKEISPQNPPALEPSPRPTHSLSMPDQVGLLITPLCPTSDGSQISSSASGLPTSRSSLAHAGCPTQTN